MPLPPSTYMGLTLPTPGSDSGVWDDYLNTALGGVVDGHRHIPGEGRQVPTDGINIDDDLPFNGYRATGVDGVQLTDLGAVLTTGATELFANSGDLWYRNDLGQNVRVTLGSTINFTGFGGIGGDYSLVGALLAYSDSGDRYTFQQEEVTGVRHFAKNESADLILHPFHAAGTGGDVVPTTTIKANASLASSYALTLPTALPGSNDLLVQVTSLGQVSFSNTVSDLTVSTDLTVSGSIVASNDSVFEQDLTVEGNLWHSDQTLVLGPTAGAVDSVAALAGTSWNLAMSGGLAPASWSGSGASANSFVAFSLPLLIADRIKQVSVRLQDTAGAHTLTMGLYKTTSAGTSLIGSTWTSDGTGSPQTKVSGAFTETVVTGTYYAVRVKTDTGTATTSFIYGIEIIYDRPS